MSEKSTGAGEREKVASDLVAAHFNVEPSLERVFVLRSEDPAEPIRLLEVNSATAATGSVEPIAFSRTKAIPYATVIAEITPQEMLAVTEQKLALPAGWSLIGAAEIRRPKSDQNGSGQDGGSGRAA